VSWYRIFTNSSLLLESVLQQKAAYCMPYAVYAGVCWLLPGKGSVDAGFRKGQCALSTTKTHITCIQPTGATLWCAGTTCRIAGFCEFVTFLYTARCKRGHSYPVTTPMILALNFGLSSQLRITHVVCEGNTSRATISTLPRRSL
jgi:hypothetical protein